MGSLSDIKRRLISVKQTRRITGAMKTVSVAKMQKALELYEKNRAYADMLSHVMFTVSDIGISNESAESVYFKQGRSGKKLVIVISSNRGLCGGFDNDIFKLADGIIDNNTVVMPIGSVAANRYKSGYCVMPDFADYYVTDHSVAEQITKELISLYGKDVCEVFLVYSEITSHASYKSTAKKLLPIQKPVDMRETAVSIFEPSETEILRTLIPMYLSSTVYGAILNNTVSEHCARRAAMSSATESADKLIESLSVEYNRARQTAVTEQIIEIIGSTGALEQQGAGNEKRS